MSAFSSRINWLELKKKPKPKHKKKPTKQKHPNPQPWTTQTHNPKQTELVPYKQFIQATSTPK